MDLKDIKAVIDLMKKNAISEFELERQDFKIKLKRGNGIHQYSDEGTMMPMPIHTQVLPPMGHAQAPQPAAAPAPATSTDIEIKSPMVGTFYRSPSPEASSYVEVGSEVNPDMVVCIIEAMKVMNEIKAEVRGVITQVMVENAKPVEFGQVLYKVRPL
ncbi:MAG TPA: acetyl-CoA carboxylase biotin carboxyl carrier protein [Methylomirabilota bacterium]|nr:acetyl-CoA carboxylase biotin carboxyl carrier protein [Methylomirabilota bacterium]